MVERLKQYNNQAVNLTDSCIINGSNNTFIVDSCVLYIVINGNNNKMYVRLLFFYNIFKFYFIIKCTKYKISKIVLNGNNNFVLLSKEFYNYTVKQSIGNNKFSTCNSSNDLLCKNKEFNLIKKNDTLNKDTKLNLILNKDYSLIRQFNTLDNIKNIRCLESQSITRNFFKDKTKKHNISSDNYCISLEEDYSKNKKIIKTYKTIDNNFNKINTNKKNYIKDNIYSSEYPPTSNEESISSNSLLSNLEDNSINSYNNEEADSIMSESEGEINLKNIKIDFKSKLIEMDYKDAINKLKKIENLYE